MVKCSLCGRELKDASGLAGHMRIMHKPRTVDDGTLEALREDVSELRQVVEQGLIASKGDGQSGQEAVVMPSFEDFLEHCEQCDVHGQALHRWVAGQQEALTLDDLKRLLQRRGATIKALWGLKGGKLPDTMSAGQVVQLLNSIGNMKVKVEG